MEHLTNLNLKLKLIKQRRKFFQKLVSLNIFSKLHNDLKKKKIAVLINLKSLWGLPTKQEPQN